MKITTRDFAAAVSAAAQVTERRNTIPILAGVAIEPREARMVARATDLDIELSVDLCEAPSTGAFVGVLVDPRRMLKLMRGIDASGFTLANEKGTGGAQIDADNFSARVDLMDAGDLPRNDIGAAGWSSPLPKSIVDVLLRVSAAMSTEETRYYLNGVYVQHLGDWTYRLAATDGHRLYFADVQLPGATPSFPTAGAIVPRKAIGLLSRLRDKACDEPLSLAIGTNAASNSAVDWTSTQPSRATIQFHTAGKRAVTLATKLIDGTYPDIARVIPKAENATTAATLNVADLRRVAFALASGGPAFRSPPLRLTFDAKGGVTIGAKFVDLGFDGRFELAADIVGQPMTIGFNGNYLVSLLNGMACERVTMLMTTDAAPTMFVDPDGGDMTAVLMPMRV